jgi:hypothetical protein
MTPAVLWSNLAPYHRGSFKTPRYCRAIRSSLPRRTQTRTAVCMQYSPRLRETGTVRIPAVATYALSW